MLSDNIQLNTNWNNIEHIVEMISYTPINNSLKCIAERSFPTKALLSKNDNLELGICLSNPENLLQENSDKSVYINKKKRVKQD